MAFAIINMKNYSSLSSIKSIEMEATREKMYANIDPERTKDNRIIAGDLKYFKAVKSALQNEYYTKPDKKGRLHKEPKIKGIGIVCTYSPAAHLENDKETFEKWIQENKKFLEYKFPGCNIQMTLHMDETTPHLHAFVIPQMKNGKISKTHFIGGKRDMYRLQDEYAKKMEVFGLERGVRNSRADEKEEPYKIYREKTAELESRIEKMKESGDAKYNEYIERLTELSKKMKLLESEMYKLDKEKQKKKEKIELLEKEERELEKSLDSLEKTKQKMNEEIKEYVLGDRGRPEAEYGEIMAEESEFLDHLI